MSEHTETTEKIQSEELEKIDLLNLAAALINGIKKIWLILLIIIAACTARSFFSTTISYTPQYVASATVSVTTSSGGYANFESTQELAAVYPYIQSSGVLSSRIESDLGLDYVPASISLQPDDSMNMMTINVTGSDAQQAYDVLQSFIKNYPDVTEYIFGDIRFEVLDETGVPKDTQKKTVIYGSYKRGAAQGIAISFVVLCIYAAVKRTVRTKEQLKKKINLTDLGSLPYIRRKKRKDDTKNTLNILSDRTPEAYNEAMRRLRIRVMRAAEKSGGVILVTSSVPGEGKTTVAVNLAIALAKQGKSVILADCDTRNPSVAGVMNDTKKHPGIGAVLRGKIFLSNALSDAGGEEMDLKILYGGKSEPDDAAMLGSKKMGELIEDMRWKADYVILDSAPAELMADASMLAKYADGVLYVIRCDYTKLNRIRNGVDALAMREANILGYVFNGDLKMKTGKYGYGYGYGYGYYGKYGSYGRYSRYSHYGHYSSYSRYGRHRNTGKKEDESGRVFKE